MEIEIDTNQLSSMLYAADICIIYPTVISVNYAEKHVLKDIILFTK